MILPSSTGHTPATGVQHGGFACTVAADHGNESRPRSASGSGRSGPAFLIDSACVEGLGDILDLKHLLPPPLPSSHGFEKYLALPVGHGQGKQPPQKRSAA